MLVHGGDCSASGLLSSCITKEQQRKTYSSNVTPRKPYLWDTHHDTMDSEDKPLTGDNRRMLTKITRSCPTMHCFTAAPFRKLVFQKGTEPSRTSSTLLVKGKGNRDPRAPVSQHLPFCSQPPLSSHKLCGFFFFFLTSLFFFPTKMEKKDTWMCSFSEEISFCWGSNKHELLILTEY